MKKNVLILCCGYPYATDAGFGYHLFKVLEKTELPPNVDLMEVGYSACYIPHVIEGKDKLIVVDTFYLNGDPGTVLQFKPEEVPLKTADGKTDTSKFHLIETLEQIRMTGKCPETVFLGVVPKDSTTESEQLTPEIQSRIPVVLEMVMKEIK
jgi:hydrogenase maturation protease